jgi:hypothetical protein
MYAAARAKPANLAAETNGLQAQVEEEARRVVHAADQEAASWRAREDMLRTEVASVRADMVRRRLDELRLDDLRRVYPRLRVLAGSAVDRHCGCAAAGVKTWLLGEQWTVAT